MKIRVKAKTGAKNDGIKELEEGFYEVSVKERPKDNEANFAIMKALAKHFSTSLSGVRLVSGRASKNKVFEIN